MKVHELIALLLKCEPDAEVRIEYDYDGDVVQEDMNFVNQTTVFGIGDEGDDVVYVTLYH